jgi:hypothetical protein
MGHLNDHRAEYQFADVTITDDIDAAPDLAEDQHPCQAAAGLQDRYHIAYRDGRRSITECRPCSSRNDSATPRRTSTPMHLTDPDADAGLGQRAASIMSFAASILSER